MKKLLLSLGLLAGIGIFACSSDDDSRSGSRCTTCEVTGRDAYQVCQGSNGHAFIEDTDSGIVYGEYVDTYCE